MLLLLLARLDAGDRALFVRWSLTARVASAAPARAWRVVTHVGGARATILASLGPLLVAGGELEAGARLALTILAISHLLVQLVKRTVGRPRPAATDGPLIAVPDRFSFPSGHAAAVTSLALGYGLVFPGAAPALASLAVVVGVSRVVLGVHYPGDVLAGALLACLTALALPGA